MMNFWLTAFLKSNFKGGVAFITIKGAFKIYHKQQQYIRQRQRRIMDYTDTNIALYRRQRSSDDNQANWMYLISLSIVLKRNLYKLISINYHIF